MRSGTRESELCPWALSLGLAGCGVGVWGGACFYNFYWGLGSCIEWGPGVEGLGLHGKWVAVCRNMRCAKGSLGMAR